MFVALVYNLLFLIFVRLADGKELTLNAYPSDTIATVKKKIHESDF